MSKTLIGIVTFGNTQFTKVTIDSIKDTTQYPIDFYVVVGKPNDTETIELLNKYQIKHEIHYENFGFPYSLNNIYDFAFKLNEYDNLIIVGNDIVTYPFCIDSLIKMAETSEYLCISALQYDVKDLVREFPETHQYFSSGSYNIYDFSEKPWEKFKNYSDEFCVADMQLFDIQNCCLYKRKLFEEIGYTDINFYPAYFVDNDYANRIDRSGLKCCSLVNARFFHFWSRTIHQGSGGSTNRYFDLNRKYYARKWQGVPGAEKITPPLKIDSRVNELAIIKYWRDLK